MDEENGRERRVREGRGTVERKGNVKGRMRR